MKAIPILIFLLAVSVFMTIWAERRGKWRLVYIFKPLATLLVIAVALLSLSTPSSNFTFTMFVLVGLLFSLGGDVALMFQQHREAFLAGLASFLLAHVVYTIVFTMFGVFSLWDILSILILSALGAAFYIFIKPGLNGMQKPVVLYIVVISIMVNRAVAALVSPAFSGDQALMIAVGAALFYLSDVILAANRFWKPLRYRRVNLVFYYSGQLLIALSASYFGAK